MPVISFEIVFFRSSCRRGRVRHNRQKVLLEVRLDQSCIRTEGLAVDKTHWARPIDAGPFYGYPLRTGVTFTYLGVAVDDKARVQTTGGSETENIFAAGEVMAGNILGKGYLAGIGMTIGTVFGRIAGEGAARHALS